MRHIMILVSCLLVASCGPVHLSNMENMAPSDRLFQLSTKTNDELCHIFNNVYIKSETEKQVAEILRERGVGKCDALFAIRIIPPVNHGTNTGNAEQVNSIAVPNVNKIAASSPSANTETKMAKLVNGSKLMYNEATFELNEEPLSCPSVGVKVKVNEFANNNKINIEQWNEFLKKFIISMPEENRDNPLRYLLTCYLKYDNLENIVHFNNVIFLSSTDSRISINTQGHWRLNDTPVLNLSFEYCFTLEERRYAHSLDKLHGQNIKIYADSFRWEKDIRFQNVSGSYCERAELSLLDNDLLDALDKMTLADKSVIRFYGDSYYSELELDNKTKCKLKSLILTVRSFNKKVQK